MRSRLTRRLGALAIFTTLLATPALQAAEPAALNGAEQARFLSELKRFYKTTDERKALLAHSNELLNRYAVRAAYQVGQSNRHDLVYQLNVSGPGELMVHEQTRAAQGMALVVRNQRLSVFGLDPYIRYDCPLTGQVCVLMNPADGGPWLSIRRDHDGAAELAKALSFLLRNLQKG
ncbi:hypothetical protein D3879_07905 [Pseudomonas cavernicola]|uniref:Uncharacterized protein n=1 Tax=Pseudomonas cavernicola TaxID=2320866 RepID=A0A418XPE7_9PSED|nr:hypothetical protein [Pseudomonas cavernicola]RJG14373.1 hypothetical protein D3879_07905 [Pseudomonas cavernicola]